MIAIGVLGYGYWGPNLVRVFSETPGAIVSRVADPVPERLARAQVLHAHLHATTDSHDVIADPSIDAVVLATPVATHAPLALEAMRAGKHVLVEKPLADCSRNAARLADEAARTGCVLMVDHTLVYSSAVREIRRLIADGAIGDLSFYDATRTSLARFQPEAGVLWDLAVHDLSILDAMRPALPSSVAATGVALGTDARPDVAVLTLRFDVPFVAHIHVNWVSAVKLRRTSIGGTRGTIVYDDMELSEKVKVYERDWHPHAENGMNELRVAHRAGAMSAPRLPVAEPLRTMAQHFVECVASGRRPDTDGASALRVIRWIEAACASIADGGRPVALEATTCPPT